MSAPLSELAAPVTTYPQTLKNVVVTDKDMVMEDEAVLAAVKEVSDSLGDTGRVLLRKSGTEPVLRVMAEAPTEEICEKSVDAIIDAMRNRGVLSQVK